MQDGKRFFLKRGIADTRDLIDEEDVGVDLDGDGETIEEVPPGLDLNLFSPRKADAAPGEKRRILTMLRPATPRRGFNTAVKVFSRLLAEPGDVAGLVNALSRLLDDPGLRQRLVGNCRQSVMRFDRRHSARKTIAFLERCLRPSP